MPDDRAKMIAAKLFARKTDDKDDAPKMKGIVQVDQNGYVHLVIPQRLTMDVIRYKLNEKGKDSFGLCVDFGQLEFVAVSEDQNGQEIEQVLKSSPVYVNVNNLR